MNSLHIISNSIHWILRITMAYIFLVHGYPKLGKIVANLGYLGYLIGPFEVIGGLLLLIGPFSKEILTRIGGAMLGIIMIGAIYMHLFKWNDTLKDVEWQILIVGVSLFLSLKDSKFLEVNND